MFERFTDRARRVIVLAQEEARRLNHNYIGTEHILLGLSSEGEGIACKALAGMGVSLDALRAQVEDIIGNGDNEVDGHIPFTPRAKKVLELSFREAQQLGHNYIGTEHILLGIVREGEGVAAQVLARLGVNMAKVRHYVHLMLSGADTEQLEGHGVAPLEQRASPRNNLMLDEAGSRTVRRGAAAPADEGAREEVGEELVWRVIEERIETDSGE